MRYGKLRSLKDSSVRHNLRFFAFRSKLFKPNTIRDIVEYLYNQNDANDEWWFCDIKKNGSTTDDIYFKFKNVKNYTFSYQHLQSFNRARYRMYRDTIKNIITPKGRKNNDVFRH